MRLYLKLLIYYLFSKHVIQLYSIHLKKNNTFIIKIFLIFIYWKKPSKYILLNTFKHSTLMNFLHSYYRNKKGNYLIKSIYTWQSNNFISNLNSPEVRRQLFCDLSTNPFIVFLFNDKAYFFVISTTNLNSNSLTWVHDRS